MRNFKGTKGEWLYISSEKNIVNPGRPRVITSGFTIAEFTQDTALDKQEIEANAQLIAASPEMGKQLQNSTEVLEALLSLLGERMAVTTRFGVAQLINKNKNVINKALGG